MSNKQLEIELTGGILSLAVSQNYTPWGAVAEWVDNSIQAFIDNKKMLGKISDLEISIHYEPGKVLRIRDNSSGMDLDDLQKSFAIGSKIKRAKNDLGQNNAGMKVACMWMGNDWTIKTKKFDSNQEITVKAKTENLVSGNFEMDTKYKIVNTDDHYTVIEIKNHWAKRHWKQNTIRKTKKYIASTYRFFIEKGVKIKWTSARNDEILKHHDLLIAKKISDQKEYKWDFSIGFKDPETNKTENVEGYIALLESRSVLKGTKDYALGSGRINAGFSLFRRNRMIQGYPDPWKPEAIFGEASGGSNDRINQRVFGVLHFDSASVDQQKSQITHADLELLEGYLEKKFDDLGIKDIAVSYVGDQKKDITKDQVDLAKKETKAKIEESDVEVLIDEDVPSKEVVELQQETAAQQRPELEGDAVEINLGNTYTVNLYPTHQFIDAQPHLVYEQGDNTNSINVLINLNHPYVGNNVDSLEQYFTDCIFEALGAWKAAKIKREDGRTVLHIKDRVMRLEKIPD